jgi:hypothetical protein
MACLSLARTDRLTVTFSSAYAMPYRTVPYRFHLVRGRGAGQWYRSHRRTQEEKQCRTGLGRPYAALSGVVIACRCQRSGYFGIFGWQALVGIGFFASGVLFYGLALKLPLYVAQSVVALQFVGAILARLLYLAN